MALERIATEEMAPGRNGTMQIWKKKWHPIYLFYIVA